MTEYVSMAQFPTLELHKQFEGEVKRKLAYSLGRVGCSTETITFEGPVFVAASVLDDGSEIPQSWQMIAMGKAPDAQTEDAKEKLNARTQKGNQSVRRQRQSVPQVQDAQVQVQVTH